MRLARKFVIVMLAVSTTAFLFTEKPVYAGDYDGNDSGGIITDCYFPQAFQLICSDGTGGASWHIYSTSTYSGPTYGEFYGDILTGNITVEDIKETCHDNNYDYYVAYGWDGRWNGPGTDYVHWGPAQWNRGIIAGAQYNSGGALGATDAIAAMENGSITDGQRITQGAAEAIHEAQIGTKTIPDTTGYFCSPYRKEQFFGRIHVAESTANWANIPNSQKTETDWTQSGKKITHFINNCDPVKGCSAKFWHNVKRNSGSSNTTVSVTRTSNYNSVSSGALVPTRTENFANGNTINVYTDTLDHKLFPGQTVCEVFTFRANPKINRVSLTACAVALGGARPSQNPSNADIPENPNKPSTDTSNINIKVRNASVSRYNNYQREVYAKPGDILAYRATYSPTLQYTYNLIPQRIQINNDTIYPQNKANTSFTLGSMFNSYKPSNLQNWSNAFSIQKGKNNSSFNLFSNYAYAVGSNTLRSTSPNRVTVTPSDVGYSIDEKAITNLNTSTKTTPSQVTFSQYNKLDNEQYVIEPLSSSNMALDINGSLGSIGRGTNVQIYWKNGTPTQDWILVKNSDDTYTILNPGSNMAVDLFWMKLDNGSNIAIHEPNGTCAQKWRLGHNSDNTYTFYSACSPLNNKAMDVAYNNTDLRANVYIYDANGSPTQKWRLSRLPSSIASVTTDSISKTAHAKIPYNFINTTQINATSNTSPTAGSTKTFVMQFNTSPRRNNITNGTYATIVPNARYKLEVCYGSNCYWTKDTVTTFNASRNLSGNSTTKNITINVPDIPAGTNVCLRSAVYPKNSYSDTNISKNAYDPNNSNSWSYSSRTCYSVVKKPTIQIWGGNIYSRGTINTSVTAKNSLAGYDDFKLEGSYGATYIFGSWGELGVISNGPIKGFASGASSGYAANKNGTLIPNPLNGTNNNAPLASNPGGSHESSLCNRSPLTFANSPCSTNATGALGNSTTSGNINQDKTNIVSQYIFKGRANVSGSVTLNDKSKIREEDIYYYYGGNNNLVIPASTIAKSTTQVVHSNKDITITGNIIYSNRYQNFEQIPKLIIYAGRNININCNVNRIDAILIAENKTTTCSNSTNINARANSNQLIINGAVITGSLVPNRTYGAATGANSIVPAEIINFDPTLYRWGSSKKETSGASSLDTDLTVIYKKDIPPRH